VKNCFFPVILGRSKGTILKIIIIKFNEKGNTLIKTLLVFLEKVGKSLMLKTDFAQEAEEDHISAAAQPSEP